MKVYRAAQFDNRDAEQMYMYLEARIDVLKRRISELENENQVLRIHALSSDEPATEERESCPA